MSSIFNLYVYIVQAPLGVILKNETARSEMIEIEESLQKYVPVQGDKIHRLLFRGDQLTVCRARSCAELRINSDDVFGRLETFIPIAEDWHTFLVILKVIASLFLFLN